MTTTLPSIPAERVLLTKRDVATLLQVSIRHVENLVRDGKLPKPIRLGCHPRWRQHELLRFISEVCPESK